MNQWTLLYKQTQRNIVEISGTHTAKRTRTYNYSITHKNNSSYAETHFVLDLLLDSYHNLQGEKDLNLEWMSNSNIVPFGILFRNIFCPFLENSGYFYKY